MKNVRLLFASRLRRSGPARAATHAHAGSWQLEYALSGPIVCYVGERRYGLAAGSMLVMPPGQPHREEAAQPADSYLLRFTHGTARRDVRETLSMSLRGEDRGTAERVLDSLVLEQDGRGRGRDRMIAALLDELMVWVLRWSERTRESEGGRGARARVRDVADMLRRSPGARFTVADLARRALLSRSRFAELFNEETGASPIEFHRRAQMEKAVEFSQYTDLSWAQIARQLGYDDPAYFSRAFKRVMGASPSQYTQP